jgi:hypothetical protein
MPGPKSTSAGSGSSGEALRRAHLSQRKLRDKGGKQSVGEVAVAVAVAGFGRGRGRTWPETAKGVGSAEGGGRAGCWTHWRGWGGAGKASVLPARARLTAWFCLFADFRIAEAEQRVAEGRGRVQDQSS